MALSFIAHGQLSDTPHVHRKVLVTGAGGSIGSYMAEHCADRYDLRLMDHDEDSAGALRKITDAHGGEVVVGDITDLDTMKKACAGIDTVIHLAADPSPNATWDSLLPTNIVGTYNTFAAAKSAGCRRVIYASSIHAVSGYPADQQVKSSDPSNPGDLYGVTKCFGEALSRYMASLEGLSAICVRIGAFQPEEKMADADAIGLLDCFVSKRDLTQLLCRWRRRQRARLRHRSRLVRGAVQADGHHDDPRAAGVRARGQLHAAEPGRGRPRPRPQGDEPQRRRRLRRQRHA